MSDEDFDKMKPDFLHPLDIVLCWVNWELLLVSYEKICIRLPKVTI